MSEDEPKLYSTTVSDEQHWRKGFEKIGVGSLRVQLATSKRPLPDDYLRCAHEWISEKESERAATETLRYKRVLGWTIAGAIAAVTAAVASVISFFR